MAGIAEKMALLFKESAADLSAAAKKRADDSSRPRPAADEQSEPPRARGRLLGDVAMSPGARPGGAAPVAPVDSGSGGPGWQATAPGDRIGYDRVATGPSPTIGTMPPEPSPKQQSREDFNAMMRDFQQAHENGRDVR